MNLKRIILRTLWVLAFLIATASLYFYLTLPHYKALLVGGFGAFLVLNLLFGIFFISRNIRR